VVPGALGVVVMFLSRAELAFAEAKAFIGDWLKTAAVRRTRGSECAIWLH